MLESLQQGEVIRSPSLSTRPDRCRDPVFTYLRSPIGSFGRKKHSIVDLSLVNLSGTMNVLQIWAWS